MQSNAHTDQEDSKIKNDFCQQNLKNEKTQMHKLKTISVAIAILTETCDYLVNRPLLQQTTSITALFGGGGGGGEEEYWGGGRGGHTMKPNLC